VGPRLRVPVRRAWPTGERAFSGRVGVAFRDGVTMLFFFVFVITPSLFIAFPAASALTDGSLGKALSGLSVWGPYWQSVLLSYTIGVVATVVNVAAGLPVAVLLARKQAGRAATALLDALVNVPIVVPSIALGVSLSFFWAVFGGLPEFWVLVLSHTTITYTYFVRAMSAAIEDVSPEMEDTARSLGARPLTVFRKVTLPLAKYAVLSGAILVFTRSVDETGAAKAVSRELKTAPVLLVEWVRGTLPVSNSERALGVALLALTSFIALLVLRLVTRERR
ncbi:MAG: ABC transporter permease subunit, partial [Candidatus Bathyarchaeia archaeon]